MEHKRDDRLQPTKASPAAPTRRTTVLDTILPPGSGEAPPSEIAPGQEVTLPEAPRRPAPVPANTPAGPVVVPTPDGGYATLRKKAKTVGKGDSEIELKELSSEEKAKKRFRYNLIMWSICAFILSVVFVVLVWPAIRR